MPQDVEKAKVVEINRRSFLKWLIPTIFLIFCGGMTYAIIQSPNPGQTFMEIIYLIGSVIVAIIFIGSLFLYPDIWAKQGK